MTIILVVLTVAIILTVELVRRARRSRAQAREELITEYPNTFEPFDRYFHPGHTWALVTSRRKVTVGVDDFSALMTGLIGEITLPRAGAIVRQGEFLSALQKGSRRLMQVSPLSGRIVEVNKKLLENPNLVNESPFDRGWIAKIAPSSLESDLRNLLKGFAADGWRDAVRTQLIHLLSPRPGLLIQDGGELVGNLGEQLSDEEWNRVVAALFPFTVSNDHRTNE